MPVFSNFAEFFVCVKEAQFTFGVVWNYIVSFYYALTTDPSISAVWNGAMEWLRPVGVMFALVLVAIFLVIALFGQRLFSVLKFIGFFIVGFALGTYLLAPLLPPEITIPDWIVGIVVALIAAVLSRFLYFLVYIVFVGYSTYVLTYYGFYLQLDVMYSNSRMVVCIIASIVAIVLALIFKKYIEMAATAAFGAWCAILVFVNHVYNFTTWGMFGGQSWIGVLVGTIVVGLIGLFVQYKTRRRY